TSFIFDLWCLWLPAIRRPYSVWIGLSSNAKCRCDFSWLYVSLYISTNKAPISWQGRRVHPGAVQYAVARRAIFVQLSSGRFRPMAEGVGFEPTIRLPVYTLSKRAPSATRPSLRGADMLSLDWQVAVRH